MLCFFNSMKTAKQRTLLLLSLALFLLPFTINAEQLFSPPQKNYQYSGRIDFQAPQAPSISWPGSSVTTQFTGTSLSVTLEDQKGNNYFNVFIDNDFDNPVIIACKQGKHTYLVAENLTNSSHTFTLFKRTEGEEGRTKFLGLTLADGEQLLTPLAKPTRKIEIFGDSITSGMGNEAKEGQPDHILSEKNNFLAYGAITARNLNAQYVSTSQSGIGIMISWFDFIMPQFYDQLDAVGNNDSKWDFSLYQPDVVVINLFQNDSWLVDREKRLLPMPNEHQIELAYMTFLAKVRAVYPDAYIVAALGSMDATRVDSPWMGYIKTAVKNHKIMTKDNKIDTLFFMFDGFGAHPRVKHHQKNAELLTQFIKNKMQW
ncbi:MAG: GDSL-type esterase/lipase family protein [Colwellia sp.]